MAYIFKIGVGDNPTQTGSYVDLSSNEPAGAVFLNEPPFSWKEDSPDIAYVRQGVRKGKKPGAVAVNNAKLTVNFDLYASNQTALLQKLNDLNKYITLAEIYSSSNGTIGSPIVATIQLHATSKPTYIDIVGGTHIGPSDGKLMDANWLNAMGENFAVEFECLPEMRGDKVRMDNHLVNGDFMNVNKTGSGLVDGWAVASGGGRWSIDASNGYYGANCLKWTGGNTAGTDAITTDPIYTTNTLAASTTVCASIWIKGTGNAYNTDVKMQVNTGTTGAPNWVDAVTLVSLGAGQMPTSWTQYYTTYTIPFSNAVQLRLVIDTNAQESTSTFFYYDGAALWANASTPPTNGEYLTIPGNLVNPTRIYNVAGTVPVLFRVGFDPIASTSGGVATALATECGVNPHEASGAITATAAVTGTEFPIPMCLPMTTAVSPGTDNQGQYGGSGYTGTASTTSQTVDMKQRVYLVKARIAVQYLTNTVWLKNGTFAVPCDDMVTIGADSTQRYLEIARLFYPPTNIANGSGTEGYLYGKTISTNFQLYSFSNQTTNTPVITVPHIFYFRTDWGYVYSAFPSGGAGISLFNSWVIDSTAGYVQVYKSLDSGVPNTAIDFNADIRGMPLRLMPGAGNVNDLQVVQTGSGVDITPTNFYFCWLEYTPKYRGSLRV